MMISRVRRMRVVVIVIERVAIVPRCIYSWSITYFQDSVMFRWNLWITNILKFRQRSITDREILDFFILF